MREGKNAVEAVLRGKIDQDLVNQSAREYLQTLESAGLGESLEAYGVRIELEPGECRWCRRPREWCEVRSVRDKEGRSVFGDFGYWRPTCTCFEDRLRKSKMTEADRTAEEMKALGVPERYALADFSKIDRKVSPAIREAFDKAQEWVRLGRWKEGTGIVLLGAIGTGKTMTAVCIMRALLRDKLRGRFVQTASLAEQIIRSKEDRGFVDSLLRNEVLILDDLDKVAVENDWTRSQVFGLIDSAYAARRVLVITSSAMDPAELASRFSYDVMSRILGSSEVVQFRGTVQDDYRRRG